MPGRRASGGLPAASAASGVPADRPCCGPGDGIDLRCLVRLTAAEGPRVPILAAAARATDHPRKICQTLTSETVWRRYDSSCSNEDISVPTIAYSALVRLTLLATASMLAASRAVAQSVSLHGVVYADANANSRRDASERGVPGVIVSNQ